MPLLSACRFACQTLQYTNLYTESYSYFSKCKDTNNIWFGQIFFSASESRQGEPEGGEHEEEAEEDEGEDEAPGPLEPGAVGDAGDAEDADEDAAGGGEHIGEAVTELEGKDGSLARDIHQVGKLGHDGHGEGRLGGATGHDDVEQGLEDIHHAERGHLAQLRERAREAVEDGVDDVAVLEDEDDATGESDHQGGGEDVLAAGKEELGDVVGSLTVDDAADNAHGKEEGRNLGDIPAEFEHSHHEGHNGD